MGGEQAVIATEESTGIAIGIGCRKGCPADDIVALVREAISRLSPSAEVAGLFSVTEKTGEPGLAEAAAMLRLPLSFLDRAVLNRFAEQAQSRSSRVEEMFGLPSVAETAALAGAGAGATLLVPRLSSATATCAIAGSHSGAPPA